MNKQRELQVSQIRHCEPSEAIQKSDIFYFGLPRRGFAPPRNDG